MNKITNPTLKNEMKKVNNLLIIGICLIVLAGIFVAIGFYSKNETEKNSTYLNEVIENQNNKTNVSAKLTISYPPYSFAKYNNDTDKAFYIVSDNNYYYIVYMNDSLYNKLNTDDIKNKNETVYGKTTTISKDIQELAIEAFNEGLEENQKISIDEFNSYFGLVYLDTTIVNDTDIVLYIVAVVIFITSIILFCTYLIRRRKNNKFLKNLDEEELKKIEAEIEDKEAFHYKKANLILTKNYIISFINGLVILNYQDILWIYERKLKQYGVTTQKSITLVDKKGKYYNIACLDGVTKKSKAIIEEIMETIINKNSHILVGFTKENQKQVKNQIKDSK